VSHIRVRSLTFYIVVAIALLILIFKLHYLFLPGSLAVRIGHNSESLGLALLFCALVQYVRPWAGTRILRIVVVFVALAIGYLILHFAVAAPTVSTLDECFSGAAYVWLYMVIPKRFRSVPITLAVILLVLIVFFNTEFIIEQAESLIPLLLAPLAFDVFDKTILDPSLPDRRVLRVVWMLILAAIGFAFMAAASWARADLVNWFDYFIDYGERASEAYWAWILIHIYFGWVLPPRLRRGSA
jgi:hypothetical protein